MGESVGVPDGAGEEGARVGVFEGGQGSTVDAMDEGDVTTGKAKEEGSGA